MSQPASPQDLRLLGLRAFIFIAWIQFKLRKTKIAKNLLLTKFPLVFKLESLRPINRLMRELNSAQKIASFGFEVYFQIAERPSFRIDGLRSSFKSLSKVLSAGQQVHIVSACQPPADSILANSKLRDSIIRLSSSDDKLLLQLQKIAEMDFVQG